MNRHQHKKTDSFLLLLIFFLLLLISLFVYLQKIDRDIKNYSEYQKRLQNLIAYNSTMDKVFLRTYRYINYDHVVESTRLFERDIAFMKDSNFQNEFGEELYKELLNIEKEYKKKLDILEHFQSPNARATNAIHYLFDLQKNISRESNNTIFGEQHKLYDQIFFQFGRILMGIPIKNGLLNEEISRLKYYSSSSGYKSRYLDYFYKQVEEFLSDVKLINKKRNLYNELHLENLIKSLSISMTIQYELKLNQQKTIALSFFVLAFLILIILYFNYKQVLQKTRELLAFRYAIENSDNIIIITDADRNIEYANDAFELYTGYSKEEVIGKNPRFLKSNLHNDKFYMEMNDILDSGRKWDGELINKRKDGSLIYEKASIIPIVIENEIVQYLAIKLDITNYVEQQKKLQQSAVAFETIGDGILITDRYKNILSVNPAFINMFGYSQDELIGKKPTIINFLEGGRLFYRKMWSTLMINGRWSGKMHSMVKEGRYITIWLTITIVRGDDNNIQNFVAIFTNLEEIIEMEERVDFLAYHDDLTKLPNRVSIERDLIEILALAKLSKSSVAILFIDLDRFKVINDTLGHDIGDRMLITIANRVKNIVSDNDILARFGGDEFIVVMSNIKSRDDVSRLASKILALIREPISVGDYHLNTTASIGISIYPEDGKDISSIIKHSDSAMYFVKDRGKDNYKFYTQKLSLDMQNRLNLEQKLLYALERDELSVVFQPQYDLKSREIVGVEALIRWNNPELGKVSPDKFIPVAEETGVIVKIGYFVFKEALKSYQYWKTVGIELGWIAINISTIQFRQKDLYESFMDIIKKSGISASNLELEITERCMMEHTVENLDFIDKFREMGISIAVDDFGTGYSSMNYLQSLPLDKIKIDKSFIDSIYSSSSDKSVSKAIIELSHSLGYKVIAEGIESRKQEDFLRDKGCDYGQGFYYSRPLNSEELIDFVLNRER